MDNRLGLDRVARNW